MRKLLSLLTVLTLTVPVPLNVIACGGKSNPVPDTDDTNYLALAQTAKDKIQSEFANLVNDESNLRRTGDVTNGAAIMAYLKSIGQTADTVITQTASRATIDGFLEVLKAQVLTISNNLVTNYPELKPLFNSINPNDILKIDVNDLDTILTNKIFDWKNNDFGLANFDAKKDPYNVIDWYYLAANLKLDFTCLDENAKANTTNISQSYNMYFANDSSDLNKVVSTISDNVFAKFQDYLVNINSGKQFNLSKYDQDQNLKSDILTDLNNKISNPKVKINSSIFLSSRSDNVMTGKELNFVSSSNYISNTRFNSKTEVTNALKNDKQRGMNYHNQTFETYLNLWKFKSLIPVSDLSNVSLASRYHINDWNYDNLTLLPLTIPIVVVENQTRMAKIDDVANKYATIFMNNGILKNKLFISSDSYFILTMNKTDFENYKNNDNTFGDVIDYANDKIKKYAISQGVLDNDDLFWAYNRYMGETRADEIFTNKILNQHLDSKGNFYIRIDSHLFRFNLNINGYEYETYSRNNITINQGDNDSVWPT